MLKVETWLVYAVVTLLLWGISGFMSKLAVGYMSPNRVLGYQVLGALLTGVLLFPSLELKFEFGKGAFFGILLGVSAILGSLFFLLSVELGKVSVVTMVSALYPLVTILLAFFFLKEPITLKQGMGMILALIAMALLSS